jgi:hypothetical protein
MPRLGCNNIKILYSDNVAFGWSYYISDERMPVAAWRTTNDLLTSDAQSEQQRKDAPFRFMCAVTIEIEIKTPGNKSPWKVATSEENKIIRWIVYSLQSLCSIGRNDLIARNIAEVFLTRLYVKNPLASSDINSQSTGENKQ